MGRGRWSWVVPDGLWEIAKPLIPPSKVWPQGGGSLATPEEALFAAIICVLVSGCAWWALPPCFGVSESAAHRWFVIWSWAGVWGRLHEAVLHRVVAGRARRDRGPGTTRGAHHPPQLPQDYGDARDTWFGGGDDSFGILQLRAAKKLWALPMLPRRLVGRVMSAMWVICGGGLVGCGSHLFMSTSHIGPGRGVSGLSHRRCAVLALAVAFLPVPVIFAVCVFGPSRSVVPPVGEPAGVAVQALPPMVPEAPSVDVARKELAALTVEAPHSMRGYSRDKFEDWVEDQWPRTQEVVLRRDGKQVGVSRQTQAGAQHWHSPYDDRILTTKSEVHVDHVVPLANAWRSGADEWSPARRHRFANDLSTTQLIAVSDVVNMSKGDQSPDQWVPPNTAYHCVYGRAWTHVKFSYGLAVTKKEKTALRSLLNACP
jgi:transposase